ncbi:MAG TPA: sialidase family protein [Thermoleophilaceae bacterium]|nr:sialidase family protein [Thermoleophilaceae bacterium]
MRPRLVALAIALTGGVLATGPVAAAAPVRIGTDPYASAETGVHHTAVEPDSFAAGRTIVAAFQIGRYEDGGAANVGFATSTNAGATWTQGALPGITVAGGGPNARVTDAAVAYDPKHKVWLIESTALDDPPSIRGNSVVVNRSTDGGASWSGPVTVAAATGASDFDKNWIACDQTPSSPHYGNCYAQWDDYGNGGQLLMSTSTDGGKTWGSVKGPANGAFGLGGQPVVQPGGKVVVPYETADETAIAAFRSTNGGASWTAPTIVSGIYHNTVAGEMRVGPLPSAEVDRSGRVYVTWEDCRFRGCGTNDIVIASSADGVNWTDAGRVPIDPVASGIEHFVPGLGVDRTTSGGGARLGLAYHFIDNGPCSKDTCAVRIGFINSLDGGRTWSRPAHLAGPMRPVWLAPTSQGYMSGDYISTSFVSGLPHPVFAAATAPSGGALHEAIYAASPAMRQPRPARTLRNLSVKPFRFRPTRSGASTAAVRGARVSYKASARGPTRFSVSRRVTRHGDRCDPPRDTCRTWVGLRGSFSREDARGANSFRFTGRIQGVALEPGLYRLRAEPRDESRPAATPIHARFRIVSEGDAR